MPPITRRSMLAKTSALGGLAFEPSAQPREEPRKLKIIVTGGHPGDPEYGCGGTIARFADLGHRVVSLYLNQGEKPEDPPENAGKLREAEAIRACAILKADARFAGQRDGKAIVDALHYESFRAILQNEAPDAVFTHWPIDNHADHRAIFMLVYDAWLKMGKTAALYFYEVSNGEDTVQFSPTDYVDISKSEPRKREACFAHASQSPERFYALQDQIAKFRGIERGFERAEAFVRHVQSLDVPLP